MVVEAKDERPSRIAIAFHRLRAVVALTILVTSAYFAIAFGRTGWPEEPGDCAQLSKVAAAIRSRVAKLDADSRSSIDDEQRDEIVEGLLDIELARSEEKLAQLTPDQREALRLRIQERKVREAEALQAKDAEYDQRKSLELGVAPEVIAADRQRYRSEDMLREASELRRRSNDLSPLQITRNRLREAEYNTALCETRAANLLEERAVFVGTILAILALPVLAFLLGLAVLIRVGRWLLVMDKR